MHQIPMYEASPDFLECWKAAGSHLNRLLPWEPEGRAGWLRSHPYPPWLEHLSFRLGNQLFFIRIEDIAGKVRGPGTVEGLLAVANGCHGHACVMPMRQSAAGEWSPVIPGWGLQDYLTRRALDPTSMVSDRPIEMTEWELQDLAVQVVRSKINEQGRELMSWVGQPGIDPAIWFEGDNGPEFVVVRRAKTHLRPPLPDNIEQIQRQCASTSEIGHFASVVIAPSGKPASNVVFRGEQLDIFFSGLLQLPRRK